MKKSAGILFYRFANQELQFFLVHPGGPFWAKKDEGSWSIPKGEIGENESPILAAIREVEEETGIKAAGDFIELRAVKQKNGKIVQAWAQEKNIDAEKFQSNFFEMEWPPRSGIKKSFLEIDRAGWFNQVEAEGKIIPAQIPLIRELVLILNPPV